MRLCHQVKLRLNPIMDVTVVNRNTLKGAVVLGIGIILLGACFLAIVVSQPCSWLDLSLNYTGCRHQLDIGGLARETFARDLTMFAGDTMSGIRIWRISDGMLLSEIPGETGIFSPDSAFFVATSEETVSAWRTRDWVLQSKLNINEKLITGMAIAPDMSTLAVIFRDYTFSGWKLQIWQTSDGILLHQLDGHTDRVSTVAYSPDGTILASGGRDHTVRLWRVEDGRLLNTLKGHTSVVERVVFAPDGRTLASASWDDTVRVWRTEDGTPLYTLKGHHSNVLDIAYSPDGAVLASAGSRGVVQLWDVKNGARIRTLRQNWTRIGIEAVAFSPDGRILATAQRYGPVRLFDVQQLLGTVTD